MIGWTTPPPSMHVVAFDTPTRHAAQRGMTAGAMDALIASALPQLSWHGDLQNCRQQHKPGQEVHQWLRQGVGEGPNAVEPG